MRHLGENSPDVRLLRAVVARYPGRGVGVQLESSMTRTRIVVSQAVLVDYDPVDNVQTFRYIPFNVIDITGLEMFYAAWEEYVGGAKP